MKINYVQIITLIIISFNIFASKYEIKSLSGVTNGYVSNNVVHWDDIPYAEPPIGDLRWKLQEN